MLVLDILLLLLFLLLVEVVLVLLQLLSSQRVSFSYSNEFWRNWIYFSTLYHYCWWRWHWVLQQLHLFVVLLNLIGVTSGGASYTKTPDVTLSSGKVPLLKQLFRTVVLFRLLLFLQVKVIQLHLKSPFKVMVLVLLLVQQLILMVKMLVELLVLKS